MKAVLKISILLIFIVLSAFAVKAQEKVWSIGPEAGLSFSRYGSDASNNNMKTGAIGGLFLTYSIKNTFGVTGKVLYAQKGATIVGTNDHQTLNYIEVPIVGRFFFTKGGTFRPNIFIGPSFGFLTGVSDKIDDGDRVTMNDHTSVFNTFDFGATGGFGFNFLIMPETYVIIDARYTQGFSDISKGAGVIDNNSIGITAGISFGF